MRSHLPLSLRSVFLFVHLFPSVRSFLNRCVETQGALTLVPRCCLQETCKICFEEYPVADLCAASCKHYYCKNCWQGYVHNAIDSGPTCLDLRCPDPECKAVVGFLLCTCVLSIPAPQSGAEYELPLPAGPSIAGLRSVRASPAGEVRKIQAAELCGGQQEPDMVSLARYWKGHSGSNIRANYQVLFGAASWHS